MHARDERGIDDEIGAGGAADRAFIAWQDAEGFLRLAFGHGPQDPHLVLVAYQEPRGAFDVGVRRKEILLERRRVRHRRIECADDAYRRVE